MKKVAFGLLAVGDHFFIKGVEYIKTNKVKISCCQFRNATQVQNAKASVPLKDSDMVDVEDTTGES